MTLYCCAVLCWAQVAGKKLVCALLHLHLDSQLSGMLHAQNQAALQAVLEAWDNRGFAAVGVELAHQAAHMGPSHR